VSTFSKEVPPKNFVMPFAGAKVTPKFFGP
jgi:hypothetical protein